MPWSNQGGGPWGSGKGPWGSGPQQKGPTPPDLEEMLRRGQDKLRRFLPGGNHGRARLCAAAAGGAGAVGLLRLLPRRAGRARRRSALRAGGARGAAGPELPPALSGRERAHAQGAARQQDRHRHARGRRRPPRQRHHARRAGRKPDAHRRREHRRRRLLGAVEGQADRRRRLSLQHPESRRHGEGGGRERHARGDRPLRHPADPDRRAPDHRERGAGADAEDARPLRRRHRGARRCSCRRSTRRRR